MLAVIAVPAFSPGDAAWIAAIRRAHDPQHERVAAHVTLGFPHDPADPDAFAGHVAATAAVTPAIDIGFDRLSRMEDDHAPKYRFLNVLLADMTSAVPLTALYRAHGGRDEYAPHVTLSRFGAVYSAKALERQLGPLQQPLTGRIAALQLLKIEHGHIRIEAEYALDTLGQARP
jgi:2'-5' RNA ligase